MKCQITIKNLKKLVSSLTTQIDDKISTLRNEVIALHQNHKHEVGQQIEACKTEIGQQTEA